MCLHRFGMMHRALQKDPAVLLSKMSATLYALSDPFGDLKPRQCHAVMHRRILRGQLVVWRCPSQLPWTSSSGKAVPIPSSRPVPSNCIVVSRAAFAMTRLAGGDFDGDLCCVSSDENFIAPQMCQWRDWTYLVLKSLLMLDWQKGNCASMVQALKVFRSSRCTHRGRDVQPPWPVLRFG